MYMMISLSHQSIYPINGFLGLQNCFCFCLLAWPKTTDDNPPICCTIPGREYSKSYRDKTFPEKINGNQCRCI